MIEYPKAIYKGNPDEFETKVVNDSDEEFEAKSEGFVEFCYLGEIKQKTKSKKSNTAEAAENGNNELLDATDNNSELAAS